MSLQTLRLPRGLWEDLEQTIISWDRMYLTEVARELNLPVQEVLRRILGTGSAQKVAVLMAADSLDTCPWYDCLGDGLWRPCARQRMTATGPCQFHERPGSLSKLDVDVLSLGLGVVTPYRYKGRIYWSSEEPGSPVFREDGTLETGFRFGYFTNVDGERLPICIKGTL